MYKVHSFSSSLMVTMTFRHSQIIVCYYYHIQVSKISGLPLRYCHRLERLELDADTRVLDVDIFLLRAKVE
jgi:hypothetical protein